MYFTVQLISFLTVRHGHARQPVRVICGYSNSLLDSLPGSSLICFKLASLLLWPTWPLTASFSCSQRAFGCGFLLWLSWPWLLAFLQVLSQCPVFWLFILQTAQTGSLSLVSVPGYLVLPHFQPSWPLRERRVDGDHGSSEDMSASQHCSLASNHSLIYFFLNFIFYFGCAGSSLQHTCSRMHGLSSCGMGT